MAKDKPIYNVAVQVAPDKWEHFSVPEPVQRYVKQLEMYIMYPDYSKLLDLYPKLKPTGKNPICCG